ncbi:MAG: hypothetical protein JSW14_04385 [Candidatus Bathyarchaeum sp.]|nr:MAG: hypothetical protein JSW14_04385 [Candidatus Bathyarchaeum sp.]
MKHWKLGALLAAFCITVVCSLLFVVPLLTYHEPDLPAELDLSSAIGNAIDFFEGSLEPDALLWLDVMHRRFGITEFADSLQRYDEVLATRGSEQASRMRVFRRIADYNNLVRAEDLSAILKTFEYYFVYALYCDRLGLPIDYPELLEKEASRGDYYLTHVLLSLVWIQENGCELALPDGFIDEVYQANAAIINNEPMIVNDLKLEAAAFLYLAGQGALVDDSFIESVISSQNDDGSWDFSSDGQGDSAWHTTILGLLLLLHVEYPADSYPPMLDSA